VSLGGPVRCVYIIVETVGIRYVESIGRIQEFYSFDEFGQFGSVRSFVSVVVIEYHDHLQPLRILWAGYVAM